MAVTHCGACNSPDTAALLDRVQCHTCGASTPLPGTDAEAEGVLVPVGGMTTIDRPNVAPPATEPEPAPKAATKGSKAGSKKD